MLRLETETFGFRFETRPRPRPCQILSRLRRSKIASRDRLKTETSRLRLHPCISC